MDDWAELDRALGEFVRSGAVEVREDDGLPASPIFNMKCGAREKSRSFTCGPTRKI
jgi:hypothetical protein